MVIVTLSRIFLLTSGRPTLTRELTTPHLSSFITTCLSQITIRNQSGKAIDISSGLLETILQCFIRLIPHHPAIFRPFSAQIRSLISSLLAPTPSDLGINGDIGLLLTNLRLLRLAHHLHALLPSCAARNGTAEEWKKYVQVILKHIDRTADVALRAVVDSQSQGHGSHTDITQEPTDEIVDELSLRKWHGVAAGCERISGLLGLLSAYLSTNGNAVYQVPVKPIYELADRMLSITPSPSASSSATSDIINRHISREERELVYMQLPYIHTALLRLLSTMTQRTSLLSFGFAEDLLDQLAWIVQRSTLTKDLCIAIYQMAEQVIDLIGPSLDAEKSVAVNSILRLACRDLLPKVEKRKDMSNGTAATKSQKLQYDADSFMPKSKTTGVKRAPTIHHQNQAVQLLLTALIRIPASTLVQIRLEIDGVAVLLQDQKLQLASVLNSHQNSKQHNMNLIPFLENVRAEDVLAQALMHRRVDPIINRPVYDQEDSMSEAQDTINNEPEILNANQPNFQFTSSAKYQIPQPMETVIHASAVAETAVETIAEPRDQATRVLESIPNQPESDIYPETRLSSEYDQQGDALSLMQSRALFAAGTQEVEMENAAGYESNDSSEIPEIVVDSDASDSDDIDDETIEVL